MTLMYRLTHSWAPACDRRGLQKFIAEVAVPEPRRSSAARSGREVLLACALDRSELDEVLSEIALLTVSDAGEAVWRFERLTGSQAAAAVGGSLSAHFAKSFFRATWVGSPTALRSARAQVIMD